MKTVLPSTSALSVGFACALVCVIATLASFRGHAADRYYVGPSGGFWSNPNNWSDSPVGPGGFSAPGPNDNALIQPSSSRSVSLDTDIVGDGLHQFGIGATGGAMAQFFHNANTLKINERLSIADVAGSQATYSLNGGTLNLTGDDFLGPLLVGRVGTGILNIAGGAVITTTGNVEVGVAGDGTVNHASGTLTVGDGRSLFIGRLAGSQGAYYLSGSASLSLYGGNIQLGYEGNGSFTQNGGTVLLDSPNDNADHVFIANAASASGSYTINSGTLSARSVRVGGDFSSGGTGALTVNGGTVQGTLQVWNNGTVTLNNGTINVGSDPLADNIRNDGLIINNGGSLIVGGRIYGTGEIVQLSGTTTYADQTAIDAGGVTIDGGAATATGNLLVGRNTGSTGILNVTGGTLDVSNGVLGIGNTGSVTSGSGTGHMMVSNATVTAASIIMGSATGGSGDMIIENGGEVIVLGGFSVNDEEVKSGKRLRVLYNPAGGPSFEDPNLHNRIVAGYRRDGALNVTGGTVSAPEIVVGLANGNGTLNMSSGSVTAMGNLLVGVDSTSTGVVNITGGTLDVSNGVLGVGNGGSLTTGNGHGSITVANAVVTAASIQLGSANGGTGEMTIDTGGDVTVLGGFSLNDLNVKPGGSLRVLYNPTPPSFEDPVLHNRMVGGYLRDGALNVTGGTVSTPEMLLGVTVGKTGTLTMNSGSLTVENNLVVGDCAAGADGVVTLSGGTIYVTNPSHTATLDLRKGSFLMTGGTLVVDRLIVNDGCGATFTRTGGTIIFTDTTPPVIHCPANIDTSTDAGQCSAVKTFTVAATDDSGSATVVCSPPSGSTFSAGTTSVNCTATDGSGNQASCSFTVTVADKTLPVIGVCPANQSVNATSPAGAVVTFTSPGATDNCSVPSVSCSPASGSTFPIGVKTVTCTATDGSANHSACTFTVKVKSAAEQVSDLKVKVNNLSGVKSGIKNSLVAKLNAALAALSVNDRTTACARMQDFINLCLAQKAREIPATVADQLITDATRIRAVIGCP